MNSEMAVIEAEHTQMLEPKYSEVAVADNQPPQIIPPEQLPDLDEMTPGFSLKAQYREFETPGETVRAILSGFTSMLNQKGDTTTVAVFQNKSEMFVNAGANLVSQVKNLPLGTAVEITYTGREKTKNGYNVKTFNVRLLTKPTLEQRKARFLDWSASNRVNVDNMHDVARSVDEIAAGLGVALVGVDVQSRVNELRKAITEPQAA